MGRPYTCLGHFPNLKSILPPPKAIPNAKMGNDINSLGTFWC